MNFKWRENKVHYTLIPQSISKGKILRLYYTMPLSFPGGKECLIQRALELYHLSQDRAWQILSCIRGKEHKIQRKGGNKSITTSEANQNKTRVSYLKESEAFKYC